MPQVSLKAKLIMCNAPSKNFEKARRFYSALLGSDDFVRGPTREVETYNRPLSSDGIDLSITQRYDDREGFTCYFAVNNLDQTLEELRELGGTIEVKPTRLPSPDGKSVIGAMAVMLDPDGNHVGLIQLDRLAHGHFRWGEYMNPLQPDQVEGLELGRKLAEEMLRS
jgi:predicted enzyme related to lactoylglutathione lyase